MINLLFYLFWSFALSYANNPFIWKGTRWCGYGSAPNHNGVNNTFLTGASIPKNETESLAINKDVDSCCKSHDQCPHNIARWKRKYHLLNWRPFTVSSCECDSKFLKCLKKDKSLSAQDIKRIYFDILEVPCFKFELKDVRKCVERTWFMACSKYAMKTELFAVLSTVDTYKEKAKKKAEMYLNRRNFPILMWNKK